LECKLLSHPDKLLKRHLSGTLEIGLTVFRRNKLFINYEDFISAILLFHDLGKSSSYFQTYISKTGTVHEELKRHAEISALWFYFYSKEILNLDEKEAVLGYIIIKHHHADFNNFNKMCVASLSYDRLMDINQHINYDELKIIYEGKLDTTILSPEKFKLFLEKHTRNGNIKSERKIRRSLSINDYLFMNYCFSVLLTADKCDAIVNQNLKPVQRNWKRFFVDNFKKQFRISENTINYIRNSSYDEVEANIKPDIRFFSINLPTGAGKTLTVLNAALKLKDEIKSQRIIYCLPFTSVIDQNAKIFEDVLQYNDIESSSDTLLKHHHLTELEYISNWNDESRKYSAKDSEFFIEGWESEMVVTTFYQLLHTLLSNKNKSLRKFHNLTNSIIILDEVQAIPNKYWGLIKTIFKKGAELLNIHFILVTATMPLIFSEEKNEIMELAVSKADYFKALSRIRLCTEYLGKGMHIDDFKELLLDDVKRSHEKSRLIILNTVKSSLAIYSFLKENLGDENLVYLSSNIIPDERLKRILNVKENPKGKIIVSTQLVEAGVDIDMDIVYRDMAPLDSIFQACGRCNRNNSEGVAEVWLFQLQDDNKPFHSYIYDEVLIDSTKRILTEKNFFEEKEFLSLSQQYFEKVSTYNVVESDSDSILNNISKIFVKKAFVESSDNNDPVFKLIDSFSVVSAYIETDIKAKDIYTDYRKILEADYDDPFQKRIKLKTLYRKMAPYIINIPEQCARKSGYDETLGKIWFITDAIIEKHYDKETGFKRDAVIVDYIF